MQRLTPRQFAERQVTLLGELLEKTPDSRLEGQQEAFRIMATMLEGRELYEHSCNMRCMDTPPATFSVAHSPHFYEP